MGRSRRARVALGALIVVALAGAAYVLARWRTARALATLGAEYVGSARCRSCHEQAYDKWRASHHARAMQPARTETVLGDFSAATFAHRGETWRFYRRDGRYMVRAEGPDGAPHDYVVAYTFGVYPLQQYLIRFPGGRLQCLSVAWDVPRKRWFFLYPGRDIGPDDWLHWTRGGQNWNGMCADCHSTNVRKGFDPEANRYRTEWSEISVGCEACHGPASRHLAWAARPALLRPELGQAGLPVLTKHLPVRDLVEICAPCHARRAQIADQGLPGAPLLDRYLPALLTTPVFYPDGQIRDEDFEYHAFSQSKMHAMGVRCTDCHDVHSGKRYVAGNALCTRCHVAADYDHARHHHHKAVEQGKPSAAAQCVSCHMPSETYMVVHLRRDHSLRVPLPEVSRASGAPNACLAGGCHADKSSAWLEAEYNAWYWRPGRVVPQHYGPTFAAAQRGEPTAEPELIALARAPERPAVVRATAVELLGSYRSAASQAAIAGALSDPDPLVRYAGIVQLRPVTPQELVTLLGPQLGAPLRALRAEAAARLTEVPLELLDGEQRTAHARALAEYVETRRYMSDLPSGPYNLANVYANLGQLEAAEREYRRTLSIDAQFHPAKSNLALVLARRGDGAGAERLLREAWAAQPEQAALGLNLGLLLAERGEKAGAERALRAALLRDPRLAQAAHNLALLLRERDLRAAVALSRRAVAQAPDEPRYAHALAYLQEQAGEPTAAIHTLEALLARHPRFPEAYPLLGELYERAGRARDAEALYARALAARSLPAAVLEQLAERRRRLVER